jgi:hypothetical protein
MIVALNLVIVRLYGGLLRGLVQQSMCLNRVQDWSHPPRFYLDTR